MNVKLVYQLHELHAAAEFIWKNNKSVVHWPKPPQSSMDVLNNILETMRKGAESNKEILCRERETGVTNSGNWCDYIGTGGYYILYALESEPTDNDAVIEASILVDPGVSQKYIGIVTESIDTD